MPRPRQFDRDDMLDAAVVEFWRNGYHALGLDELLGRIGLSRASMYRTFGTKSEFYAQALNRYRATEGDKFRACLDDADSALDAIAAVFDLIVDQSLDGSRPRGCLVVSAITERAAHDDHTARQVDAQLNTLCELFDDLFRRGVSNGEFPDDFATTQWADFVVAAIQGIRVVAAAQPNRERLANIAAGNIAALAAARERATLRNPSAGTQRFPTTQQSGATCPERCRPRGSRRSY